MFENIMLPVDGSQFSEMALPLAIRLARQGNARLHIARVHVPAVPSAEAVVTDNYDALVREWERDALDAVVARARAAGADARGELLTGPIVAALQAYIVAAGIDLVVMTTHGRSGIKRAVLGSVAEQCVRKTEVPVLLLHAQTAQDSVLTDLDNVRRILVPLDGSAQSEKVLPHVAALARVAHAELVLTRIAAAPFDIAMTIGAEALNDYQSRMRAEAEDYLEAVQHRVPADLKVSHTAVSAERAADGILRMAEEHGADMIAMATHGRSGWARIALGSVSESVLHKSARRVLLIKSPASAQTSADLHSERNEPAHSGD